MARLRVVLKACLCLLVMAGCLQDSKETPGPVFVPSSGVRINEVYTKGPGPDWVELHNVGDSPVDLTGWAIIDGKEDRIPYVLPGSPLVQPHSYFVVKRDETGMHGFAFGLGAEDTVSLLDADGAIVSHVEWVVGDAPSGRSWGRVPDQEDLTTLEMPTPGQWNAPSRSCVPSNGDLDCGDAPPEGPSVNTANLYAELSVITLHLDVSDSNWAQLMEYREKEIKEWVPCTLTYDGETATQAAVRLKGRTQDWSDPKQPLQFIVRFDRYNPDGRFRGLRRINLEASSTTMEWRVRNNVALFLMRRARVISSRANHARLFINGEFEGIYENIEVVDREFLEDQFVDYEGNLYKSGALETNKGDGDTSHWDALIAVVSDPDVASNPDFIETFTSMVNVPSLLNEIAVEALLGAGDNFWARGMYPGSSPNFFMYDDPINGFTVIPWDLDIVLNSIKVAATQHLFEPFDAFGDDKTGSVLSEPWGQIQADPKLRAAFLERLGEITSSFYLDLPSQVDRYCALIRDDFEREFGEAEVHQLGCVQFRAYIEERSAYIQSFLEAEAVSGMP